MACDGGSNSGRQAGGAGTTGLMQGAEETCNNLIIFTFPHLVTASLLPSLLASLVRSLVGFLGELVVCAQKTHNN